MSIAVGQASDRSGLRFNHYTDTIQAAVNGQGVALGWSTLLRGHLQEGRLVRLGQQSLTLDERYHLLVPLAMTCRCLSVLSLTLMAQSSTTVMSVALLMAIRCIMTKYAIT